MFEQLEPRRLMSVTFTHLNRVRIVGSDAADVVSVRVRGEELVVTENGRESTFRLVDVTLIEALGGAGDDHITVDGGVTIAARLVGGDGNDVLVGGDGHDHIWGGGGDDRLEGNAGEDRIHGGGGNDTALGGAGADLLTGGAGADALDGGDADDRMVGGSGDDTLSDSDGNNTLRGGGGRDVSRVFDGVNRSSRIEVREPLTARADPGGDPTIITPGVGVVTAAVTPGVGAGYSEIATVTLRVPAGAEVMWGDPQFQQAGSGGSFTVDVNVQYSGEGEMVEVTRTFELGTLGLGSPNVGEYTFSVTSAGQTLDTASFTPEYRPLPFETFIPIGLSPAAAELDTRVEGGSILADVLLTFSGGGFRVEWGEQVERVGNEFFIDVEAERWTGPMTQAIVEVPRTFNLGNPGPGSYAVTLRSRAGVVATTHVKLT